jgi:predicted deacylase
MAGIASRISERTGNIARRWWLATAAVALLWVAGLGGIPLVRSLREPPLPIRELRGAHSGPTVALVAGVHGGKVAAVHALEALGRSLDRTKLHGTVLLVGPANRAGYRAGLAQTSPQDSLNLNRVFPGRYDGSYTERLAAKIVRDVVARSDFLIDMHGSDGNEAVGRFAYAARPGITPSVDTAAMMLALGWGVEMVVRADEQVEVAHHPQRRRLVVAGGEAGALHRHRLDAGGVGRALHAPLFRKDDLVAKVVDPIGIAQRGRVQLP